MAMHKGATDGARSELYLSIISDYLAESTISFNLQGIATSVMNTIKRVVDIVVLGIFIQDGEKMLRVIPEDKFDIKVFEGQSDEEYVAYDCIRTGKTIIRSVEAYPHLKSREELKKFDAVSIVTFPIRYHGVNIAALSLVVKNEFGLDNNQKKFCRTIIGYLSVQLKNTLLHEDVKRELEEKNNAQSDIDTIFNESVDFISIIGEDGCFKRINPAFAKKLGYTEKELIGTSITDYIYPEDVDFGRYILVNIASIKVLRGFYNRYVCRDGKIIYLELNVKYIESGKKMIAIARDITNQRETEAKNLKLQQTITIERIKSEFFQNLSHEFKTPLNIISSSLELVKLKLQRQSEEIFQKEYIKYFDYTQNNCLRLMRLTTNLIDATKIDSGFFSMSLTRCDMKALVSQITESVYPYAAQRDISLRFISRCKSDTGLYCDTDKIDRILLNLISNAIKNTPHGGKIRVTMSDSVDFIRLSVSDTGVGIDEKDLPNLFQRFRISYPQKSIEGNGIGLSIVKSLVEMHDGTIHVQSKLAIGTKFIFTISRHLHPDAPQQEETVYHTEELDSVRISKIKMEMSDLDR